MRHLYFLFMLILLGVYTKQSSAQISNYCASNGTSSNDSEIDSVALGSIQNKSTTTCTGYTDYTSQSTTLAPSGTYTVYLKNGTCGSTFYSQNKGVWIDFNQDNDFSDPGEQILTSTTSFGTQVTDSATFTVPATALSGTTYMRVISKESGAATPCGTYTWGETEDYSIVIKSSIPDDAGVSEITKPSAACEGTYNVKARINNFGINQIVGVDVQWEVNGILQTPYTYSDTLDTLGGMLPSSVELTLGSVTLTGGSTDTIKAWTEDPNSVSDGNNLNDTAFKTYLSSPLIDSFPYYEDFENGNGDWIIGGTNSSWALGTPSSSNITGASSGVNAFNTNLSGSYFADEASEVSSPCFNLSEFTGDAWIAIDVNWYSESSYDGAVLQYTVDGGTTWQNVGATGDPYNWFNRSGLFGSPGGQGDGWAGTSPGSNGWLNAKHIIDAAALVNGVKFRVAFGSDGSINYDGFAFDNIAIVDFNEADLGDEVSLCGTGVATLDPGITLNGNIVWSTGDSSSATIQVSTQGQYWVSYTDTMLNLTTYDTTTLIQSVPPSINFEKNVDTISVTGQITLDPRTSFDLEYDWQPGGYNFPYLLVKGQDVGLGVHNYTLTVTDSINCYDIEIISLVVLDFTGIDENEQTSMNAYPNPVSDFLNIEFKGLDGKRMSLELFDLQGKMIYSEILEDSGNNLYRLNVQNYKSGVYFLNVRSEDKSLQTRIIVK